jgi:enoyl-CoA hydratase/carnithine racemase
MTLRTLPELSPRLTAQIGGAVATVTITNPARRNCVDLATWQAIPAVFAALDTERELRVIILRGAGDEAFCAGADIAEFDTTRATPEGSRAYEAANVAAFDAVAQARVPVIALIHGFCFGAGVGLASACDLRLAAEDATFAIPAAALGVGYPPTALATLVALMGPAAVKRLFFTAERLDARAAHAAGLISEVLPKAALEGAVATLAARMTEGAPLTITAAKRAIDAAAGLPGALDKQALQALADACFASADYTEGRAAFRAKRKPIFKGE